MQGELQRRSLLKYDQTKIRFGSTNALRGRLYCGICGRTLKQYKSLAETTWRCRKRSYEKKSITKEVEAACPCRIVKEKDVKKAIIKAFQELPGRREELLRLQGAVWDGTIKMIDEQIKGIEEKKQRLLERLEMVEDPESFSNEMVIRYLDKVIVNDDVYEVIFKAGVQVEIPV